MDYLYGWQVLAVVMGGCDWFQALVSAVGIPGVAGSDTGCDNYQDGRNPHKDLATQLLQQYISSIAKCIYIYQLSFSSVTCHTAGIEILRVNKWQ